MESCSGIMQGKNKDKRKRRIFINWISSVCSRPKEKEKVVGPKNRNQVCEEKEKTPSDAP
jgi:hypothetical protein